MPFEFKRKERKGIGSTLEDEGMAERLKQEDARYRDATDSETWSCLCFRSRGDLDRFIALTGLPRRRFVTGAELRAATERFRPEKRRRGFPRRAVSTVRTPSPIAGVEYTDSLENDCVTEAMALLDALTGARRPEPCREATDSDIWVCACFEDRADAESYLDEMNLRKHGDKYIDASSWLRELEAAAGSGREPESE